MHRRISWLPVGAVLAFSLAACGGGSPGPSVTAMGTIQNQPVPTSDVIGKSASYAQGATALTTLSVVFANQGGLCGAAADATPANLATLRIQLAVPSAAASTGTYDLMDPSASVSASFLATDANGNPIGSADFATTGSVTFTKVDSSALDGSFQFTFSDGQVSGTFHAPICSG